MTTVTAIATAPADAEPLFTRDSFLKPPDWRYQTAVGCLADEDAGRVPRIPTDPCVQYMARALKACRRPEGRDVVALCWEPALQVIHLGTVGASSAITAELESLLIRGATRGDPEVRALPVKADVYELYAKVFFDLSGVRAVHSWMQDYLLGTDGARGSWGSRMRSRILAYYGDGDAARHSAVTGRVSANALAMLKGMMSNERQCRLFDYVMQRTSLDRVTYATLMEAALRDMNSREFTERMKEREDAGSGSLADITAGLEAGIRAFSQSELSAGGDGLDFVNQYTQRILGNQQDGTENIDQ